MKRCISPFMTADGTVVNKGDEYPDDHEIVQGREALFGTVPSPAPAAKR